MPAKKKAAKKKADIDKKRKVKGKKKVSRQRLWQLEQKKDKKCIKCGAPAVSKLYCLKHLEIERERQRKIRGAKKRYGNAMSYMGDGLETPDPKPKAARKKAAKKKSAKKKGTK